MKLMIFVPSRVVFLCWDFVLSFCFIYPISVQGCGAGGGSGTGSSHRNGGGVKKKPSMW